MNSTNGTMSDQRDDGRGRGHGKGTGRGKDKSQDVTLFPGRIEDPSTAQLVLCCVDDTDDLSAQTSTGYVAECVAGQVARLGGQVVLGITRHQLLLSELVPYTSHNSSMCFAALMPPGSAGAIQTYAVDALHKLCAESADPGLCVAELPTGGLLDELRGPIERLTALGRKAQIEVCTKEEAYDLAQGLSWLRLTEHGGTGQGIIGALAGVGLRLSGEDGRFRGKWRLNRIYASALGLDPDTAPESAPAGSFREAVSSRAGGCVRILDTSGAVVDDAVTLLLDGQAKPLFLGGALNVIVDVRDGVAIPLSKVDLDHIDGADSWKRGCSRFLPDNDTEECADDTAGKCRNCLYRRLTIRGFECVLGA